MHWVGDTSTPQWLVKGSVWFRRWSLRRSQLRMEASPGQFGPVDRCMSLGLKSGASKKQSGSWEHMNGQKAAE